MSSQRRRERYQQRTANTDDLVFEAFDPFAAPMTISVVNDPLDDDAAVARALQEEYEAEYRRSQYAMHQQYSNNAPYTGSRIVATAPYESSTRGSHREPTQIRGSQQQQRSSNPELSRSTVRGQSARRIVHQSSSSRIRAASPRTQQERARSRSRSRPSQQESSDEEYARRLEREMRNASRDSHAQRAQLCASRGRSMQDIADEEYARRLERELSNPRVLSPNAAALLLKKSQTPATSRSNSDDDFAVEVAIMTADDESYARRIEQELADERLAETLRRQEQQRIDSQRANSLQQQHKSRRCWCTLLPILIIIGAVGGVLYFFMFGDEGLPSWMP